MGIFSRFRSGGQTSLIRTRPPETPREEKLQQAVADDVATVEQDDKYFSPDEPADQE